MFFTEIRGISSGNKIPNMLGFNKTFNIELNQTATITIYLKRLIII